MMLLLFLIACAKILPIEQIEYQKACHFFICALYFTTNICQLIYCVGIVTRCDI